MFGKSILYLQLLGIADDSGVFAKATFCTNVDMRGERVLAGLVELTRRHTVSTYVYIYIHICIYIVIYICAAT